MAETKIVLKYKNPNFGKPDENGKWGLKTDIKEYTLLVDGVEVVDLSVEYERYSIESPSYSTAYVSYKNRFHNQESQYNNHGYTSQALDNIVEGILREGQVPKISLIISDDNLKSKRVAEKTGFIPVKPGVYSTYNPNALQMTQKALGVFKDTNPDFYNEEMNTFLRDMNSYLDNIIKRNKELDAKKSHR